MSSFAAAPSTTAGRQAGGGRRGDPRDRIVAVGQLGDVKAKKTIDARGLAVAPGFINMLSWATESLLADGRSQSDIRQGVTLEVFGEGVVDGPAQPADEEGDGRAPGRHQVRRPLDDAGRVSGTPRAARRLVQRGLVRRRHDGAHPRAGLRRSTADRQRARPDAPAGAAGDGRGALGVGSSLIYAPAFYADTNELIELCKVAAEYQGMYISHMRSEGNRLLEAVDELIQIAREAGLPAEIYHLKAAGKENWPKRQQVVELVEAARAAGLRITADMYIYTAGSTGLNGSMPPWVQEGGLPKWIERMRDPEIRRRVADEMRTPTDKWENLLLAAGSPDRVLLVGFKNPALKHLTGKTLAEVAARRGTSPEETAMDLVIEDNSRVSTVYFMMDEEDVKRNIALPWVSFGSDAGSDAPEGPFLLSQPHPRTYGNVARLLGKYVRDEKIIPLEEAIRKLSGLPAANLGLADRGLLARRLLCRRGRLRSGEDPGPRHVRPTRISTPPACDTCWSTARACWPTASTPAPSRAAPCGGKGGRPSRSEIVQASARRRSVLGLGDPRAGFGGVLAVEVANLGRGEWLAERGHSLFPLRFTHHRQPLDIAEVLDVELDVFPQCTRFPAVEIVHLQQDANFFELGDEALDQRHEVFVVGLRELA